jgi:molybdate transport system regulatory protein
METRDNAETKNVRKPSRFGRHPESGYTVHSSLWLEKDGELYLGGGRVMLLERVGQLGSIAAAARSMNLTYANAWNWIKAMNKLAPSPLVEKTIGGSGGGHAMLTLEGQKAIRQFHLLHRKQDRALGLTPAKIKPSKP